MLRFAFGATLAATVGACALVASLDTPYGDPTPYPDGSSPRDDAHANDGEDATGPGLGDAGLADAVSIDPGDTGAKDAAPACLPKTCSELGYSCGTSISDGCGGALTCGDCPDGSICGGNGQNKCGEQACVPTACTSSMCGVVSNGCGATQTCPTQCSPPMECKGGGCGGCAQNGTLCAWGALRWPAWLCDDTGGTRGGDCNRVQSATNGQAYYCCPFKI